MATIPPDKPSQEVIRNRVALPIDQDLSSQQRRSNEADSKQGNSLTDDDLLELHAAGHSTESKNKNTNPIGQTVIAPNDKVVVQTFVPDQHESGASVDKTFVPDPAVATMQSTVIGKDPNKTFIQGNSELAALPDLITEDDYPAYLENRFDDVIASDPQLNHLPIDVLINMVENPHGSNHTPETLRSLDRQYAITMTLLRADPAKSISAKTFALSLKDKNGKQVVYTIDNEGTITIRNQNEQDFLEKYEIIYADDLKTLMPGLSVSNHDLTNIKDIFNQLQKIIDKNTNKYNADLKTQLEENRESKLPIFATKLRDRIAELKASGELDGIILDKARFDFMSLDPGVVLTKYAKLSSLPSLFSNEESKALLQNLILDHLETRDLSLQDIIDNHSTLEKSMDSTQSRSRFDEVVSNISARDFATNTIESFKQDPNHIQLKRLDKSLLRSLVQLQGLDQNALMDLETKLSSIFRAEIDKHQDTRETLRLSAPSDKEHERQLDIKFNIEEFTQSLADYVQKLYESGELKKIFGDMTRRAALRAGLGAVATVLTLATGKLTFDQHQSNLIEEFNQRLATMPITLNRPEIFHYQNNLTREPQLENIISSQLNNTLEKYFSTNSDHGVQLRERLVSENIPNGVINKTDHSILDRLGPSISFPKNSIYIADFMDTGEINDEKLRKTLKDLGIAPNELDKTFNDVKDFYKKQRINPSDKVDYSRFNTLSSDFTIRVQGKTVTVFDKEHTKFIENLKDIQSLEAIDDVYKTRLIDKFIESLIQQYGGAKTKLNLTDRGVLDTYIKSQFKTTRLSELLTNETSRKRVGQVQAASSLLANYLNLEASNIIIDPSIFGEELDHKTLTLPQTLIDKFAQPLLDEVTKRFNESSPGELTNNTPTTN